MAMSPELEYFNPTSTTYLANKRFFTEFLDQDEGSVFQGRITKMLQEGKKRLIISTHELRDHDPDVTDRMRRNPMAFFFPWQAALKDYIKTLPSQNTDVYKKLMKEDFRIGIEGSFGASKQGPRELHAHSLGQLVYIEGIATRCSTVRPKVTHTVHYCEATSKFTEVSYHDQMSITGNATSSVYPTKDENDNPLTTEFGLSDYEDFQTISIQEMPERAPAGMLPRSVDVALEGDLVDCCKPGDRVAIIGIYRALPSKGGGETLGFFKSVILANNVMKIGKESIHQSKLTEGDIRNIRKLAKNPTVFELLSNSIAPSIYGHAFIKKALVLLLLGGEEKNLENGTHIRGDINLLMVGDPSTAKSQLLRFVLNIAPLSINTTGRGSSGVGLTAAVTTDRDSGERRLEAGAMVLADRGVVCIDEFDKMSEQDRVAIHEVMEQQTVTIAKAGIHMSLNARCSVVAAANPVFGQYDTSVPPGRNIGLPDSLVSRFDLLFVVLDQPDAALDGEISDKVLSNHRFVRRVASADDADDSQRELTEETPVFQKFDRLLHGSLAQSGRGAGRVDILSINFMKKYIQFAKLYTPKLTEEATVFIADAYSKLRNREKTSGQSMPVTARALETLIRLSSAHAKSRLSRKISEHDCKEAFKIMMFALQNDTGVDDEKAQNSGGDNRSEGGGRGGGGDNDDDNGGGGGDLGAIEEGQEGQLVQYNQQDAASAAQGGVESEQGQQGQQVQDGSLQALEYIPPQEQQQDSAQPTSQPSQPTSQPSQPTASHKSPSKSPSKRRLSSGSVSPDKRSKPSSSALSGAAQAVRAAPPSQPSTPATPSPAAMAVVEVEVLPARLKAFQLAASKHMRKQRILDIDADELRERVNEAVSKADEEVAEFDAGETHAILLAMQTNNKIMYKRGQVHRIAD